MADSYAVGSRSQANDARSEARPDDLQAVTGQVVVLGEVLAVSEGGYRVATFDSEGNRAKVYPRLMASGDVTLAEGDKVLLAFTADDDLPEIVTVGGGGGACSGGYENFGVLMR